MKCFDSLIVDLDGVVWRDGEPITENTRPLASLISRGIPVVFLTNNSTRSRRTYALLLSRVLGVEVGPDMVVNSGYSAATWLARTRGPSRALIVGEEGLVEEVVVAGHTPLTPSEWRLADAVVVGLDRSVTYRKLAAAHRAITEAGAVFLATNRDSSYPVPGGTDPGAGSLVALLEASTGRRHDFDAGKPGQWILGLAMERLRAKGAENPLVVGDRIDTDAEMARKAGLTALIVLTGVTKRPGPQGPLYARSLEEAVNKALVGPC